MSTESASGYSRKNPFPATIATNRKLTGEGSNKDTRHLEINLSGSGLAYEVGDSLGVFPKNDTELVEGILKNQGFTGDEQVTNTDGKTVSLREALTKDFIVTEPSKQLLQVLPEKDSSSAFLRIFSIPDRKTISTTMLGAAMCWTYWRNSRRQNLPLRNWSRSCANFNLGSIPLPLRKKRWENLCTLRLLLSDTNPSAAAIFTAGSARHFWRSVRRAMEKYLSLCIPQSTLEFPKTPTHRPSW